MRVGLILECRPAGPDQKVLERLVELSRPEAEVISVTLIEKRNLISQCGHAASILLQKGCECVIIVWDLYPAWGVQGAEPCLKKDREDIRESLDGAGVDSSKVHLVCIHKMLEAWLLADEKAISTMLSKLTKKTISVPRVRRPEDPKNPKKVLSQIFRTWAKAQYQAHIHAESIVNEVVHFKRLRQCKSLCYFLDRLAEC